MIETTANIDIITYQKIVTAAEENDLKIRHVVHVLLKRMLADLPLKSRSFSRIKYQERIPGKKWKTFHLKLSKSMYEGAIDMRKLHKMSVSFILVIAVNLYLERAVQELTGQVIAEKENPDNYSDFYSLIHITTPETSFYLGLHQPPPPELIFYLELLNNSDNKK